MEGIFPDLAEQFPAPWLSADRARAVWCDTVAIVWGPIEGEVKAPADGRLASHVESFLGQKRTARGCMPRGELVEKLRALPADAAVRVGPRSYDPRRVLRIIDRFDGDVIELATASSGHVFPEFSLVLTCGERGAFVVALEGNDGAVELLPAPPVRELQTDAERKALKALTYLYDQARRHDPELRGRIGGGTQVRYLCAQAIAELTGRPVEDVEQYLSLPLVPAHHDPVPRAAVIEHELHIWRERAEDAGDDDVAATVRVAVEAWRREQEREYRERQRKAGVL